MALVMIVLKDTEDGALDIEAHAEPYIPSPHSGENPTPAQTAALLAIASIHGAISTAGSGEGEPGDDTTSADAVTRKLVVVPGQSDASD